MIFSADLVANRGKTAIIRTDYSRPIKLALADGILRHNTLMLDYGCGHGDDIKFLRDAGYKVRGWDPHHLPQNQPKATLLVNLGYVINVIEDLQERKKCLEKAWSFAKKVLIVSARLVSETSEFVPVAKYNDGHVTAIGTFQKLYEQRELKEWIESILGQSATVAGPGVFYVFRDYRDRIAFLARRCQRSMASSKTEKQQQQHKPSLEPIVNFLHTHGRFPQSDEIDCADSLRNQYGSFKGAVRIVERGFDIEKLMDIFERRRQDLLLFLALSRFDGRPRMRELPRNLQLDVRWHFSSYTKGCRLADQILFDVGNLKKIRKQAEASPIGKLTPSALYIHREGLAQLSLPLRMYEGCASNFIGIVNEANIVKLHTEEPMVSYLAYPSFDADPHPVLTESVTLHLQTFRVREHDYQKSQNPPILHRKESFVPNTYPLYEKFKRLTEQEEEAGLYADTTVIGTRNGWNEILEKHSVTLQDHQLGSISPALKH